MKTWRTESNKKDLFEVVSYTKKFLAENSDQEVRIYIGCDSQNLRKKPWTGYITAIAFHIGTEDAGEFYGHGVHVIFKSEKYNRIRDNWTRLWKEVEKSMDIAEELRQAGILVYRVDLDFNEDEAHDSNRLVAAGEGLFKGLGYRVASKPNDLLASRAADHLIHHITWTNIPLSK